MYPFLIMKAVLVEMLFAKNGGIFRKEYNYKNSLEYISIETVDSYFSTFKDSMQKTLAFIIWKH